MPCACLSISAGPRGTERQGCGFLVWTGNVREMDLNSFSSA